MATNYEYLVIANSYIHKSATPQVMIPYFYVAIIKAISLTLYKCMCIMQSIMIDIIYQTATLIDSCCGLTIVTIFLSNYSY